MTLLLFAMLVLLPWADRRNIGAISDNLYIRWTGLLFSGAGYSLIVWSGLALGRMYSADVTIQKGHQPVTTGLYRHVRHPRYLGSILAGQA
jgi:protein-S-isoprenylcysteine O-methyltransferase Ste14